jgi:6-phosphogluconolactonase
MIEARRVFKSGEAIQKNGDAVLAVSGGSTPRPFFAALSKFKLEWAKVKITLVDERLVSEDSPRSNAKLVKESLLQNEARVATFIPLYQNPDAANLPDFDVAILGMGNDGHTASFFPGGDNLNKALDVNSPESLVTMNAPGAGEPRLTFTLRRLLSTKHLCLHVQGADKMAVLDKALTGNDQFEMPVRAVLQAAKPLTLYWCP